MNHKYKSMTMSEIAEVINSPLDHWAGNCYGIASRMVEHGLVKGKVVYGKFLGDSSKGLFKDTVIPNHAWVVTPDNKIVDPTRWVFDDVAPFMFETDVKDNHYDRGSNMLKEAFRTPPPEYNEDEKTFDVNDTRIDFIMALYLANQKVVRKISVSQVVWLSSLSLMTLGSNAHDIFSWIENNGMRAFIPIDNYREIIGE